MWGWELTIESSVFLFNFVVLGAAPLGPVFLFQFCGVGSCTIGSSVFVSILWCCSSDDHP